MMIERERGNNLKERIIIIIKDYGNDIHLLNNCIRLFFFDEVKRCTPFVLSIVAYRATSTLDVLTRICILNLYDEMTIILSYIFINTH